MNQLLKKTAISLLMVPMVFSAFFGVYPAPAAEAAVSDASWIKAVSISPVHNDTNEFASENTRQSIRNAKAIGANYITLIIPYFQANRETTEMFARWSTPTDEALGSAVDYAHSLGMKVMFKLHLENEYQGDWRGNINPWDRDAWFRSYTAVLQHYGRIAEAHGVEDFCIGTELVKMSTPSSNSTNTANWIKMIGNVRSVYSGRLTYSANHTGESEEIGFWSALDYIGLSAYYDLYHAQNNTPEEIMKGWQGWSNGVITPLHTKTGKDVVFTEIGYRSIDGAYYKPWEWEDWRAGGFNETDQANSYEALFRFWNEVPWMKGISLWRWDSNPNAGGQGDRDFLVQNKLAQQTITSWWGGTGTVPAPQTPSVSATATSTASTITAQISVEQADLSNAIVNLEVHDLNGNKLHQQYFTNQNVSVGQPKTYTTTWTAGTAGASYKIVVGVFNADWSKSYYWNADAARMTVASTNPGLPNTGGSTGESSIASYRIGVDNPKHNSTVSGVTIFKAVLPYIAITKYQLSWQVDDGPAILMNDSYTGTPHKESTVDVSGWDWNGTGPYKLTFTAKNNKGDLISKQTININISR